MADEGGGVGGDEGFSVSDADDKWRARASDDNLGGVQFGNDGDAVGAVDELEGLNYGV